VLVQRKERARHVMDTLQQLWLNAVARDVEEAHIPACHMELLRDCGLGGGVAAQLTSTGNLLIN
jgi:hypothetical protein